MNPRSARLFGWAAVIVAGIAGGAWIAVSSPRTERANRSPVPVAARTGNRAAVGTPAASMATEIEQARDRARTGGAGEMCGYPDITPDSKSATDEDVREEARHLVPAVYEDVGHDLGLDAEKQQRLFDLLMDHYVQLESPPYAADATQAVIDEYVTTTRARQAVELRALLGADGFAALSRYRKTNEARYEIEAARKELESEESPLTESQRRRWLDAILQPSAFIGYRDFLPTESADAVRQEVRARIEQNERGLHAAAAPIFDADQLDVLDTWLEDRREDEIRRWTPHFARESDD